jgi:excisionase family DNA binding protein
MGIESLPEIMTPKELAEILKISMSTIRRATKSGALKYYKAGKHVRITREAVEEWITKK